MKKSLMIWRIFSRLLDKEKSLKIKEYYSGEVVNVQKLPTTLVIHQVGYSNY